MESRVQTVAAVLSLLLAIVSWNWREPPDPGGWEYDGEMQIESFDQDGTVCLRIGEHEYRMNPESADEVAQGLARSADNAREHAGKD